MDRTTTKYGMAYKHPDSHPLLKNTLLYNFGSLICVTFVMWLAHKQIMWPLIFGFLLLATINCFWSMRVGRFLMKNIILKGTFKSIFSIIKQRSFRPFLNSLTLSEETILEILCITQKASIRFVAIPALLLLFLCVRYYGHDVNSFFIFHFFAAYTITGVLGYYLARNGHIIPLWANDR